MPRIDSFTGVEVMTTAEFFEIEAEREGQGRSAGELLVEMMSELQQEEENDLKKLENDWDSNLATFQQVSIEYTEYWINNEIYAWDSDTPEDQAHWENPRHIIPPFPVELKSLKVVKFHEGFKSTVIGIEFSALCDDGQIRSGSYSYYHCSGTYYDPPEIEEGIEWE